MSKNKFLSNLVILFACVLATIILIGSIFLLEWKYPLPYRALAPVAQPVGTPAALGELTARVENLENDQIYNLKIFEWELDQKLLILGCVALFISFVAGTVGLKTYNDLDKIIQEEVSRALDKALYHLDPTNLRIWVISYDEEIIIKGDPLLDDAGKPKLDKNNRPVLEEIKSNVATEMKKVSEQVLLTGLINLKNLTRPDSKCYDGVTIVPVFNIEMEDEFRNFLKNNKSKLNPKRAAFVLYTRDYHVSQTKTIALYMNLATANMLPTVSSMILTVGRGLSEALPSPSTKEDDKR